MQRRGLGSALFAEPSHLNRRSPTQRKMIGNHLLTKLVNIAIVAWLLKRSSVYAADFDSYSWRDY